jgi:hypothetical protein
VSEFEYLVAKALRLPKLRKPPEVFVPPRALESWEKPMVSGTLHPTLKVRTGNAQGVLRAEAAQARTDARYSGYGPGRGRRPS